MKNTVHSRALVFSILSLFVLISVSCEDEGNGISGGDSDSDSDSDTDGDTDTDGDSDSDGDSDTDSDTDDDCIDGLELIYVVDSASILYSFDPENATPAAFVQIGTGNLDCVSGGQPFSMSVGRDGYAYVLFQTVLGNCVAVNKVSIQTGVCEEAIPFVCGSNGDFPGTFGMGYVTDGPSTIQESLYVTASGQSIPAEAPALGILDVSSGQLTSTGGTLPVAGAEFTGNQLGELWGFFPQAGTPAVAEIDKVSGAMIDSVNKYYDVSTVITGAPNSWAFAYWGNAFYIFYKSQADPSTTVYKVDMSSGSVAPYITDTGHNIVGAGVSTCAPVVIE